MYAKYFKRLFDLVLSFFAVVILSPVYVVLAVVGAVAMKGNPFFTQQRPGKDEKIFTLIKFRTMTCETDEGGNPLPDEIRLTKYGKFLRSTSLDELPELFNILKGDMSVVGPRPLLVQYLPLYNEEQKHRHDVLPGLTGLAQISGRNAISWEEKFTEDLTYIKNITFFGDVKILFKTVLKVLKKEGISAANNVTMEYFNGTEQKEKVNA